MYGIAIARQTKVIMGNFYAYIKEDEIRAIDLLPKVEDQVLELFLNGKSSFKDGETNVIEFNGDYNIRDDENEIFSVDFQLPACFYDIPDNQANLLPIDIKEDRIISLFYFYGSSFLFQIFNRSGLLQNKFILQQLIEQHDFNRMEGNAFIVGSTVHAIYDNGMLFFKSYTNANKIFDLSDYMVEATNEDIERFCACEHIAANSINICNVANSKTRRLIRSIQTSGTLEKYLEMSLSKRKRMATALNINIRFNDRGDLELPSNVSDINRVLSFLNEDIYKGPISKTIYMSNSKAKDV